MRTLALSVVPQNIGCNVACKFCISKSTFETETPHKVDYTTLDRACRFAKDCGAQTGIITGKGEPLLMDFEHLRFCLRIMNDHFAQIDLHTNGLELLKPGWNDKISTLRNNGLTNLTISIGHYDPVKNNEIMGLPRKSFPALTDLRSVLRFFHKQGLHIRLSCVLAKNYIDSIEEIEKFLDFAVENKVNSVIFRELWVTGKDSPERKWCKDHHIPLGTPGTETLWNEFLSVEFKRNILYLPWGGVYDYKGIAVSASECEFQEVSFVKSLILLPDNHVYTSWNSRASMLW